MKLAVSLLRVSSDRQYQEGQGINVQRRTIDYFAKRENFTVVRYFIEHYSGRKADRAVLDEIIEYLAKNEGEISALIVSRIDRFTRAGADVYLYLQKQLRALGVELVDASGVIQQPVNTLAHTGFSYEWSTRSPSRLTETIMAEQANAEASQTATEIMQASLQVDIREGMHPSECLLKAIETAREQFKTAGLEGITTAILAIFEDDYIHYATLGDGALVAVYPDGMIAQMQTPHHLLGQPSNIIAAYIGQGCEVAPRIGSVRIEPGTTVMLMSDGASELFSYKDFADNHAVYSEYLMAKEKPALSDHILEQIETARDPDTGAYLHHDNMTLVMAHYPLERRHLSLKQTLEETSNV